MHLKINAFKVFQHHLHFDYSLDATPFETKIFYHSVDLFALNNEYGVEATYNIYAHIAFFEGLKYCLGFPETYDVTSLASHLSAESLDAFKDWFVPAWSQHLYENERFDYKGPELLCYGKLKEKAAPISLAIHKSHVLSANGGGKDSYVMMRSLEDLGTPYSAYQFARTEYGKLRSQHTLMDMNYQYLTPEKIHCVSVYDDFTDGIFANLYYPDVGGESAVGNPCQVGTPEAIFEALPICLAEKIPFIAFGNEKSADEGNVYSEKLGLAVNHQWIKSLDAEKKFASFIQANLVRNVNYFSLLKPIHDSVIYKLFSKHPEMLPYIHSCNIEKPWCKKCPKCAYVWLNFMAIFPFEAVDSVFKANLLEIEVLQPSFRQLLGLGEHNAFECVGEIHETRLAFKKCYEKGLRGQAMTMFKDELLDILPPSYWVETEKKYNQSDNVNHNIPADLFQKFYQLLAETIV